MKLKDVKVGEDYAYERQSNYPYLYRGGGPCRAKRVRIIEVGDMEIDVWSYHRYCKTMKKAARVVVVGSDGSTGEPLAVLPQHIREPWHKFEEWREEWAKKKKVSDREHGEKDKRVTRLRNQAKDEGIDLSGLTCYVDSEPFNVKLDIKSEAEWTAVLDLLRRCRSGPYSS
jgi:hypothetical protein